MSHGSAVSGVSSVFILLVYGLLDFFFKLCNWLINSCILACIDARERGKRKEELAKWEVL